MSKRIRPLKKNDDWMKIPKNGKDFIYGEEKYRNGNELRTITWLRYEKDKK